MNKWLNIVIQRATWRAYGLWMVLFLVYEYFAFSTAGPWTKLIETVGGDNGKPAIPDLMYGFPEGQPAAALVSLGEEVMTYIKFNAVDLPYAFLSMMAAISIMTIGLKRFHLDGKLFRYILIIPLLYFTSELIENSLLVSMAAGHLPAKGVLATVQQLSTTTKITTNTINSVLGPVILAACLVSMIINRFRKSHSTPKNTS